MKPKDYIAWGMIAIGAWDALGGQSGFPVPILGEYLTQEYDALLVVGGVLLLTVIK